MADAEQTEVKETEPIVTDEDAAETVAEDTSPDSSQDNDGEEVADDTDTDRPDEIVTRKTPDIKVEDTGHDPLARLPDETPREYALRLEVTRLKAENRKARTGEIIGDTKPDRQQPELSDSQKEILKKYRPEEIQSLREVLPVLANELGYVRKDELSTSTYSEKAQEAIDSFISLHPEYAPENDKDNILWERLKAEYNTYYKPPQNPKDFKKVFERIHQDMFGIKVSGALPKVDAAKEKVKVASHTGGPTGGQRSSQRTNTGIRFDALKGFSEDEIADMEAKAGQ